MLILKHDIPTTEEFLTARPYLSLPSAFHSPSLPPIQPPIPIIPPNPRPPAPTSMSSTVKPAKLQLSKLKAFNGSYETAISWMHSIQFYLPVKEISYYTDMKKITFTLLYMTKGSAPTWADTFWENTITSTAISLGTWDDFLKKFQQTFKHQDTTRNAISWLSTQRMTKKNRKFSLSLKSYILTFQRTTMSSSVSLLPQSLPHL